MQVVRLVLYLLRLTKRKLKPANAAIWLTGYDPDKSQFLAGKNPNAHHWQKLGKVRMAGLNPKLTENKNMN